MSVRERDLRDGGGEKSARERERTSQKEKTRARGGKERECVRNALRDTEKEHNG